MSMGIEGGPRNTRKTRKNADDDWSANWNEWRTRQGWLSHSNRGGALVYRRGFPRRKVGGGTPGTLATSGKLGKAPGEPPLHLFTNTLARLAEVLRGPA